MGKSACRLALAATHEKLQTRDVVGDRVCIKLGPIQTMTNVGCELSERKVQKAAQADVNRPLASDR